MLLGILLALATSVSWAVGNVLIQRAGKTTGAPRAVLWAMTGGGALSALCSWQFDQRVAPFSMTVAVWTLVAAAAGVVAYVCLFFAFAHERLSVAVPLVSSWALVSALLSLTVLHEKVRGMQITGAAVVLLGVLLVSLAGPVEAARDVPVVGRSTRWGIAAALGSGIGFGVMVPAMGQVAPATGEFGASALVYAVGLALAVPLAALARVDLRPPPRAAWPLVLCTGAVETAGFVAVALARRFAPMALVAPVASLASTFTVLYAWLVLRERPRRLASVGALLASAGVIILAL